MQAERWRMTCQELKMMGALSLCPPALSRPSPLRCPRRAACIDVSECECECVCGCVQAGVRLAYLPPVVPLLKRRGAGSGVRVSFSEPEESLLKPACGGPAVDAYQADRNARTQDHGRRCERAGRVCTLGSTAGARMIMSAPWNIFQITTCSLARDGPVAHAAMPRQCNAAVQQTARPHSRASCVQPPSD